MERLLNWLDRWFYAPTRTDLILESLREPMWTSYRPPCPIENDEPTPPPYDGLYIED